ncbi:MAG: HAD family phosphatase [Acidobacteriota bacterium]
MSERPTTNDPPAVIFDYAGVLSLHQPAADWQRLESLAGVVGEAFYDAYWGHREPYDQGRLETSAYWRRVASQLGVTFGAERIATLTEIDTASWVHMNDTMVAWLESLQAAGVRTAILSNMGVDLRRHVAEAFPWVARCDHRTFSCDVGAAKPEPAIYHHCLRGLGVDAADAVFIDDRPPNLEASEALGLRGILFDEVEAFAARLEGLGLPPLPVLVGAQR